MTYFKNKVNHGDVPLPICTAVHVEKDLSAQAFSGRGDVVYVPCGGRERGREEDREGGREGKKKGGR